MNNQLITKIINTNDTNACPELTYENPLIDRNIAGTLARSFVKILRVSQQDSNINNSLRHSVLANIRQICQIEPKNHLEIDENFTKALSAVYMNKMRCTQTNEATNCIERTLEEFLVRNMKEVDINSNYHSFMNPEVAQALLNLNDNHSCVESISRDVLHWNIADKKNVALIKNLWANNNLPENVCNEMSIKIRSEIEDILLNSCYRLLTDPNSKAEDSLSENNLIDLIKKCSVSSECFQICTRILNYIFIHSNYNTDIRIFVSKFIKNVKINSSDSISVLYPAHLNFIVVLLDIELHTLPQIKNKYIEQTLAYLKRLQKESDSDLVLLLSHFPQWFSIYFKESNDDVQ